MEGSLPDASRPANSGLSPDASKRSSHRVTLDYRTDELSCMLRTGWLTFGRGSGTGKSDTRKSTSQSPLPPQSSLRLALTGFAWGTSFSHAGTCQLALRRHRWMLSEAQLDPVEANSGPTVAMWAPPCSRLGMCLLQVGHVAGPGWACPRPDAFFWKNNKYTGPTNSGWK